MCDLQATWRLNFPWISDAGTPPIAEYPFTNPPVNTIPNIRTGYEWVQVLQLGLNSTFCEVVQNYPTWFTQTPPELVRSRKASETEPSPVKQ